MQHRRQGQFERFSHSQLATLQGPSVRSANSRALTPSPSPAACAVLSHSYAPTPYVPGPKTPEQHNSAKRTGYHVKFFPVRPCPVKSKQQQPKHPIQTPSCVHLFAPSKLLLLLGRIFALVMARRLPSQLQKLRIPALETRSLFPSLFAQLLVRAESLLCGRLIVAAALVHLGYAGEVS